VILRFLHILMQSVEWENWADLMVGPAVIQPQGLMLRSGGRLAILNCNDNNDLSSLAVVAAIQRSVKALVSKNCLQSILTAISSTFFEEILILSEEGLKSFRCETESFRIICNEVSHLGSMRRDCLRF
jgi:hypothetical protein